MQSPRTLRPHPAVHDEDSQEEVLYALGEYTGIDLPNT